MATLDPTFSTYTPQQAQSYASHRSSYSKSLYEHILNYHVQSNPGGFGQLLDIGCGTGGATRRLAASFERATGLDPSPGMVKQAAEIGGYTIMGTDGNTINYEVVGAEELDRAQTVELGSVDLLTSAMAAHWFRMKEFWPQAAKMLKPSGTVALWTHSSLYCHPNTPNAAAVQKLLSHLEDVILGPFELPSNRLSRNMYDELVLPWDVDPAIPEFPKDLHVRMEWNREGRLDPEETDFFGGSEEVSLLELEQSLGTASMVTRWRQANPELVNTDDDCVKKTIKAIRRVMDIGSRDLDEIKIRVAAATVLLLFTKKIV